MFGPEVLPLKVDLPVAAAVVADHEGVPPWIWVVVVLGVGVGALAAVILRGRGEGLIPLAPPEPAPDEAASPPDGLNRTNVGINGSGRAVDERGSEGAGGPERGDAPGA